MDSQTRVGVVDDDSDSCGLIADVLRGADYDVAEFHSVDEAVAQAERTGWPAVLYLGSLRHIFAVRPALEALTRYVRVILSTGARRQELPPLPCVEILTKPVDIDTLLAAVAGPPVARAAMAGVA